MTPAESQSKLRAAIRLRHLSLSTEQSYCSWLVRYMKWLSVCAHTCASSEERLEGFLSQLARDGVSASTQNQAFNALLLFYREVLQQPLARVDALRAKRAATIREAPTEAEVRALLAAVKDVHGYPTRLIVHLIYGCGLRVTEPCNLRIKDVGLEKQILTLHCAKGGKDRIVPLPCSLFAGLRDQIEAARVTWKRDASAGIPVALPGLLAKKYPASQYAWKWAWLFPSHTTCAHPRTGQTVRYRVHEANVQLAVRQTGCGFKPHQLRHAYATHCLSRGANPRAIQSAMGHNSLETTMGYLHADALSVRSPLEYATPITGPIS